MYLAGLLVGAAGDIFLQHITSTDLAPPRVKTALQPYFEAWTPGPSIIAAAVLTGGWAQMFKLTGYGEEWFVPYSFLLDETYRMYHPYIYPTLASYYASFGRDETWLFNGITAMLINLVKRYI